MTTIDYLLSTQCVLYCIIYIILIFMGIKIIYKVTGKNYLDIGLQMIINILELLEDKEDK